MGLLVPPPPVIVQVNWPEPPPPQVYQWSKENRLEMFELPPLKIDGQLTN